MKGNQTLQSCNIKKIHISLIFKMLGKGIVVQKL